jgi:hypothetical protein
MLNANCFRPAAAAVLWCGLVVNGAVLAQHSRGAEGGDGVGDLLRPAPPASVGGQTAANRQRTTDPEAVVDPGPGVGASVRFETGLGGTVRVEGRRASDTDIIDPGLGVGAAVRSTGRGETRVIFPGSGVGAAVRSNGRGETEIIFPGPGVGASRTGEQPALVVVTPSAMPPAGPGPRSSATSQEPVQRTFPVRPSQGVSPLGFKDLDSGLRDCEFTFDELASRSPFCRVPGRDPGQRCERFSFNQFPEVVRMTAVLTNGEHRHCTATMIAGDWALTAAHCFLGDDAAAVENRRLQRPTDADIDWTPGTKSSYFTDAVVEANNAKMIVDPSQRLRRASRVVVHGGYAGRYGALPFSGDIALVRIEAPFASSEVEPAMLTKEADPAATLAGFGYSNANGGTFGQFGVTWPPMFTRDSGTMTFKPSPESRGAFCQGDSGGPVYAGRHRGCKAHDIAPEARPRPLQGVISFNHLGSGSGSTPEQRQSARCLNASSMVMQDVTTEGRRRWICETTVNAVVGCQQ